MRYDPPEIKLADEYYYEENESDITNDAERQYIDFQYNPEHFPKLNRDDLLDI